MAVWIGLVRHLKRKQMENFNNLTQEQKQTIETALNSIPEVARKGLYGTIEGIQEQISRGDKIIFYMSPNDLGGFSIEKMKIG
jgi:hypothetical protein